MGEWMTKMWSRYTVDCYSALEKGIAPHVTRMGLEGILLSEISWRQKHKYRKTLLNFSSRMRYVSYRLIQTKEKGRLPQAGERRKWSFCLGGISFSYTR